MEEKKKRTPKQEVAKFKSVVEVQHPYGIGDTIIEIATGHEGIIRKVFNSGNIIADTMSVQLYQETLDIYGELDDEGEYTLLEVGEFRIKKLSKSEEFKRLTTQIDLAIDINDRELFMTLSDKINKLHDMPDFLVPVKEESHELETLIKAPLLPHNREQVRNAIMDLATNIGDYNLFSHYVKEAEEE